jgi:protein SCO1/2
MRLFKKLLIVTLVLLAPVLVFLFLKQFGSNKFEVPVYYLSGHPLQECNSGLLTHRLSEEFVSTNNIKLPALIEGITEADNQFDSDLINVLEKYPAVNRYILTTSSSPTSAETITIDSLDYIQAINCELVFGEDRFIDEAIANKFVLIDKAGLIRGYFNVDDLEEIERLDIELDILLNYEDEG